MAMLKAPLLSVWYDLSDVKLAEALDDRAPFRRFCGFAASESGPGAPGLRAVPTGTREAWLRHGSVRGGDPPAVAYVYAPDRKAERPLSHLRGLAGTLQIDGHGGYKVLAEKAGGPAEGDAGGGGARWSRTTAMSG